jgi:hypothetical protein
VGPQIVRVSGLESCSVVQGCKPAVAPTTAELGGHGVLRVCRIRNPDMTPCEGVTIMDMGHKIGCNGVDNGQLIFNHCVAPRWV